MCGIVGYIKFNTKAVDDRSIFSINAMIDAIKSRGPDGKGYVGVCTSKNILMMGHTRLAIIDTSDQSLQPMENEKYVLSINGEIYNYKSIRKDLIGKGVIFKTQSDSEVALEAITFYGIEKALNLFHGMWALSLYDKNSDKLILCRDRVGVKPLYYYKSNEFFMYSSELKGLMAHSCFYKEINKKSLASFFKYGYVNAPHSIFENTYKVRPGEYIVIDQSGVIIMKKYWDLGDHLVKELPVKSENAYIEELKNILTKSCKLRMVSDVPVGVFLSGGVDSSLVTAILSKELGYKVDTYTIGFDEKEYDESEWAKKISNKLSTKHHELICTESDALALVKEMSVVFDEPFGDSSAIPTMLVSGFACQNVKVGLSADGGDELFFGYNRYSILDDIQSRPMFKIVKILFSIFSLNAIYNTVKLLPIVKKTPHLKDKLNKLKNTLKAEGLQQKYDGAITYFNDLDLDLLLSENFHSKINIEKSTNLEEICFFSDMGSYLPGDILTKVDRASMHNSLEAREPLLDQDVVKFSQKIPFNLKYKNKQKKYILKKLLEQYLPKDYIYRPKKGFGIPIDKWLHGDLKPLVEKYFSIESLEKHDLFQNKYVQKIKDNYYNGAGINSHKIWFILVFQMWYEQWMED